MTGRRFGAAGLIVGAGLLASCTAAHVPPGSQSAARHPAARASARAHAAAGARLRASRGPWWAPDGATPCAPPVLLRAAGHVLGVGTCTGQLAIPVRKLTLPVGQRIDVHIQASVTRLPHSSRLAVLAPVAGTRHGATQTYQAASPGHAVLVSGTTGCLILRDREARETTRRCPVVAVTVVP